MRAASLRAVAFAPPAPGWQDNDRQARRICSDLVWLKRVQERRSRGSSRRHDRALERNARSAFRCVARPEPAWKRRQRQGMPPFPISGGQSTLTITHLWTEADTTAQQTRVTTNTLTYTAGRMYFVFLFGRATDGSLGTDPAVTHPTLGTFSVCSHVGDTARSPVGSNRIAWHYKLAGASGSGESLSIDFGEEITDSGVSAVETQGSRTSNGGADAFSQIEVYASGANAASLETYVMKIPHVNNAILNGILVGATAEQTISADANYTLLGRAFSSGGGIGEIGTMYRVGTGDTAPAWTWGSSFSSLAINLEICADYAPYHQFRPTTHKFWFGATSTAATTFTTTPTMNPSVGSRVYLGVCNKKTSPGPSALSSVIWNTTPTRNFSEVATTDVFGASTDFRGHAWQLYIDTAGTASTISMTAASGGNSSWSVQVVEVFGCLQGDPQTNAQHAKTDSGATTTPSITLTAGDGGVFAFVFANHGSTQTYEPASGYVGTMQQAPVTTRFTRHSGGTVTSGYFRSTNHTAPSVSMSVATGVAIVGVEVLANRLIPRGVSLERAALVRAANW